MYPAVNTNWFLPLLMLILPCFAMAAFGNDGKIISPMNVATNLQAPIAMPTCSGPVKGIPDGFWLDQQDHEGPARGYAPFIDNYYTYPVYRNAVKGYGANNDGSGDQTNFLQAALNDDGRRGNRYNRGAPITTYEPAEVFLPSGTYQLHKTLDLRMGTIIVGDPLNPPVIRAAVDFDGNTVINGYDFATGNHEDSFMTLLKNVVIDTTGISADRQVTALQWGVAQGCGLSNVQICMPSGPTNHTGIKLENGSTIILSDVQITGGKFGINSSNQQVNFKNVSFKNCQTAFLATGGFTNILQGATFDTCGLGVDISRGGLASLVLLDSKSINSGPVIKFRDSSSDSGPRNNQIVIENLSHDNSNPIAIDSDGKEKLKATANIGTWVWGNVEPGNAEPGAYQSGTAYTTQRPTTLLLDGKYFTKAQPTYDGYATDQFVNVKSVPGYPVKGDGSTDDVASLNAILVENANACKITYFPYGVYIVKDTLFIPPGSRIAGEAWPVISGAGDKFKDVLNPWPVVKIGNARDQGVAEISEFRFTVSEVLPGAIIVEVNMAGSPGDVGIWNSFITVGGTKDSMVTTSCQQQNTASCKAAFMSMHLTASSSAYVENVWGWTADHDIDSGPTQIISAGRGLLVEATKGTWLVGTGFEHHWLYNYNFHNAQNVYAGLLQAETPYMQGLDAVQTVPAPWVADARYGDPDYSWCDDRDQKCRTALAANIDGGKDIFLYNSAFWAFFAGPWDGRYDHPCPGTCQSNMIRVTGEPENLVWYAINTREADTLVLDGKGDPKQFNNPGGWTGGPGGGFGGNLVAYRAFASGTLPRGKTELR